MTVQVGPEYALIISLCHVTTFLFIALSGKASVTNNSITLVFFYSFCLYVLFLFLMY